MKRKFVAFFLFQFSFPSVVFIFIFLETFVTTCIVSRGGRRCSEEWFEMYTLIAKVIVTWHTTRIAEVSCFPTLNRTCTDIQTYDIWWWRRQVTHQSNATRKVAPRRALCKLYALRNFPLRWRLLVLAQQVSCLIHWSCLGKRDLRKRCIITSESSTRIRNKTANCLLIRTSILASRVV